MNKNEMISTVASKIEVSTKKDITIVVDEIFDTIKETLANGEKIAIAGFGTFEVTERAARKGRNPKTSEEIMIPASKYPHFKASKVLKDTVNV